MHMPPNPINTVKYCKKSSFVGIFKNVTKSSMHQNEKKINFLTKFFKTFSYQNWESYKIKQLRYLPTIVFPRMVSTLNLVYVWFISYSKFSNWCWISKFSSNIGCLFTSFFQLIILIQSDQQKVYSFWIKATLTSLT